MRPLLKNGGFVFFQPALPAELRAGDAIVYRENGMIFLHRIWEIVCTADGSRLFSITDDGGVVEPHTIAAGQILGKAVGVPGGPAGIILGNTTRVLFRTGRIVKKLLCTLLFSLLFIFLCGSFAHLSAATRIKTVEFNFGTGPAASLASGAKYSFPVINFRLPDAVAVRSAWLELDALSETTQDIRGADLFFDQGTSAVTVRDSFPATTLVYNTGEGLRLHLKCALPAGVFSNVTANNNYAAAALFTGGTFSMLAMKLYVTYEYDDTAAVQVATVRFPLKSDDAASVASLQAMAVPGLLSFAYNALIAEASYGTGYLLQQQWFELRGHRISGGSTTDASITARIGADAYAPAMTLDGALIDSYDFLYLTAPGRQPGFLENTSQNLSVETSQGTIYNIGGECVVTYEFSLNAPVKTKTVRYLAGQSSNGASAQFPPVNLYLEEGGIDFKALYARIHSSYSGTSAAGGSGNITWSYSLNGRAGTGQTYTHLTQAMQTGEHPYFLDLWSTAPNTAWANGCPLEMSYTSSNAGYTGAQGAEIIITYQYADGAKFTDSYQAFAFQADHGNQTSLSSGFSTFMPVTESPEGRKTRNSGYLAGTFLTHRNRNTLSTVPFTFTLNINGSSQPLQVTPRTTSEAVYTTALYTDPLQLLTTAEALLTANAATDGDPFWLNGKAFVTYSYFPPPVLPSALRQSSPDGGTALGTGQWINSPSVLLSMDLSSRISDAILPIVELKPAAVPFSGADLSTGAAVAFSTSTAAAGGAVMVSGLADGTVYHWRARAASGNGISLWTGYGDNPDSQADFGVDLSSPSVALTAPLNNLTTNQQNVTFSWSGAELPAGANSGIAAYSFELSTDPAFGSISCSSDTARTSVPCALSQAAYYWRVRAADNAGNTGPWASYAITVDTTAPSVPAPALPLDAGTTNQLTVNFQWTPSSDADAAGGSGVNAYDLYVSTDPAFSVFSSSGATSGVSLSRTLPRQARYFWRVRSKDNTGNISGWSAPWSIRIDTTPPPVPVLTSPLADFATSYASVTLSWQAADDAATGDSGIAGYDIRVASATDFIAVVHFARTSSIPYSCDLPREATYYWQVRSADNAGNSSAWSTERYLLYDVTPPAVTRNVLPDSQQTPLRFRNSDPGSFIDIDFADPLSRLQEMRYMVTAQSNGGGAPIIPWTAIGPPPAGTSSYNDEWQVSPWSSLQEGVTNYVHLYYKDRAGNFGYMYGQFDILKDTTPPSAPDPLQPADNFMTGSSSVVFGWSDSVDLRAGTSYYVLQIATSATFAPVRYSAQTTLSQAVFASLAQDCYYWRVQAIDRAGNASAYSSTRTFLVDLSTPAVTIGPALIGGDATWRTTNSGVYDVDFFDGGGAGLGRFDISVSTGRGRAPVLIDWTDSLTAIGGSASYTGDWRLPDIIWQDLMTNTTNFISLRLYDLAGNCSTYIDAFFIRKKPGIVRIETLESPGQDPTWRRAPDERAYNVDFYSSEGDDLKAVQYSANTGLNQSGRELFGWTDIPGAALSPGDTYYTDNWHIGTDDFGKLDDGAANYISVRCWSQEGTTVTARDVFFVRKDTTAPDVPLMTAPLSGHATGQVAHLSWAEAGDLASGTTQYLVRMSSAADFVPVVFSSHTSRTAVTTAPLDQATYYWQVAAKDTAGNWSLFSDAWTVQVDSTPPATPSPVEPEDNFTTNYVMVNMAWMAAADSGPAGLWGYHLRVSTTPAMTPVYCSSLTVTTALAVSLPLSTTYYWDVSAIDRAGNYGGASPVRTIIVDTSAPALPSLITPADAHVTGGGVLSFSWAGNDCGPSGIKGYQLLVSTDDRFGVSYSSVTELTSLVSAFPQGLYWWKIKAFDRAGNYSQFCATRCFVIDFSSPPAPANVLPADDARTREAAVTFAWGAVADTGYAGVSTYRVEVSTDALFYVVKHSSATALTQASVTLQLQGIYYWRVSAQDAAGNVSLYSSTFSLTLDQAPPLPAVNLQPGDDAWRADATALYNVDFNDIPEAAGAGLSAGQYRIFSSTTPAGAPAGNLLVDYQLIFSKDLPERTTCYTAPWAISAQSFAAMNQGINFVFLKSSDMAGNTTEETAYSFYVMKDTAAPAIVSSEPPPVWTNSGGLHHVAFTDYGAGVAVASYTVYASSHITGPAVIDWTTVIDSNPAVSFYDEPWPVSFNLLAPGTNYVFVRSADQLGNVNCSTGTYAFVILKDTIPAQAVQDLAVAAGVVGGSLTLTWSAPQDDPVTDPYNVLIASYLVKYATSKFNNSDDFLANGSTVYHSWQPNIPGGAEEYTLDGLVEGTTYYVGIAGIDKAGNIAPLASGSTGYHAATRIPPAQISDLTAMISETLDPGSVELRWTAVGDNGMSGTVSGYIVKCATFSFSASQWDDARVSTVTASQGWIPNPPYAPESQVISALTPGATYFFAIKALDAASPGANYSIMSNAVSVAASPTGPADGLLAAGAGGVDAPKTYRYTAAGAAWSSAVSNANPTAATVNWTVLRSCPVIRNEKILGTLSNNGSSGLLYAQCYNGQTESWNTPALLASLTTTDAGYRPYDIAYEQNGGRAVVAWRGAAGYVSYRIWSSTAAAWLNSAASLAIGGTGTIRWLRLEPRKGTDEIMLAAVDSNNDIYAARWTGSAWANATLLTAAAYTSSSQSFDIAWESGRGNCLVLWGEGTSTKYAVWQNTGALWTGIGTAGPNIAVKRNGASFIKLAADRQSGSNRIAMASLDTDADWNVSVWDGTSWAAPTELSGSMATSTTRDIDIAWEKDTGECLATGVISSPNTSVSYATWNGSWSGVTTDSYNLGGGSALKWLQLAPDPNSNKMLLLGANSGASGAVAVRPLNWTGSSWQNTQANLIGDGSNGAYEFFMFTLDRHDIMSPYFVNGQPGDHAWRSANNGLYGVRFTDDGGSLLSKAQTQLSFNADGTSPYRTWADELTGINADSYAADWPLTPATWDALQPGKTYVSIRLFDGVGNSNVLNGAFFVLKDTQPPAISNVITGRNGWYADAGDPGVIARADFADQPGLSLLTTAQYMVYPQPNMSGAMICQGTLFNYSPGNPSQTAFNFGLNPSHWELLANSTNYVTLRCGDVAGNAATLVDAFRILKDTIPPQGVSDLKAMPGPLRGAVDLSWSAPGDDGALPANGEGGYDIRYATQAITETLFDGASVYAQSMVPRGAGIPETLTIPDLDPLTTYYFSVRTRDKAGNWSGVSNSSGTLPRYENIYINEVSAGGEGGTDWVELFNNTPDTQSLTGWTLVYNRGGIDLPGAEAVIWTGASQSLQTNEFLLIPALDLDGAAAGHVKLLNEAGRTVDTVQWPQTGAAQSFARIADGNCDYFEVDPTPTPGYANSISTGVVKINEIDYASASQFVEFYNTGAGTEVLSDWALRNANNTPFRFTRKIYSHAYNGLTSSSIDAAARAWIDCFGPGGLAPDSDFLALENESGQVIDRVSWKTGSGSTYYSYKAAAAVYATAASGSVAAPQTLGRRPAEGSDTFNNTADFAAGSASFGMRNNNPSPAPANALLYPAAGSFLPRRFKLDLQLGADSSSGGAANTLWFVRTGGNADGRSPHAYRLADLGFNLASLAAQTTAQTGNLCADIDGYPLIDGTEYLLLLNSDTGGGAAPQTVASITYDAAIHEVRASPALNAYTANGAREGLFRLDVINRSPAAGNPVELSSVTVTFTDRDGVPLGADNVRALFSGLAVVADNLSLGTQGSYQADIDSITLADLPSGSFSITSGAQVIGCNGDPTAGQTVACSTRTFFVIATLTDGATNAAPSNSFKVRLTPGDDTRLRDCPSGADQEPLAGVTVITTSPTIVAPAPPPTPNYPAPVAAPGIPVSAGIVLNAAGETADTVFAATGDGKLHALNSDGTGKWTFDAGSEIAGVFDASAVGFESSPYLYLATKSGLLYKIIDGGNAATAAWASPYNCNAPITTDVLYSANSLYVGTDQGKIHKINKDGSPDANWLADSGINGTVTGMIIADSPLVATNAVWAVSSGGAIYRLGTVDGSINVPAAVAGAVRTAPFLVDGYYNESRNSHDIYFGADDGLLRCRNSSNLTSMPANWHDVQVSSPVRGSPYYDGERDVYFGADNGTLYCVDFSSGGIYWTFQTGGPIRTMPINNLYNTKIFFGSDDGNIYGLRADEGALLPGFPVKTGGEVRGSPACDDVQNRIYFGSNDGRVYCIDMGAP